MTFQPDRVDEFLEIFKHSQPKIITFPGCSHLELWRAKQPEYVLFTYSYWRDEAALNAYRKSEFFGKTWKRTKRLFAAAPEAWSCEVLSTTD